MYIYICVSLKPYGPKHSYSVLKPAGHWEGEPFAVCRLSMTHSDRIASMRWARQTSKEKLLEGL